MNDKNKNTKVTLPLLVYAVIFFLFGPFAVLLLAIGVIGYICFKAKKDSSKNEIFKNGNLSGHNFGDISVDNIVTSIRDNTRDNNKFNYIAVCKIFLLLFSDIYIMNTYRRGI